MGPALRRGPEDIVALCFSSNLHHLFEAYASRFGQGTGKISLVKQADSPNQRKGHIISICSTHQKGKKRPAAVLGETRPVDPDKGCVGEVLGTEYFLPEQLQRSRVEAAFVATLSVYERPQGSPLQDVEPLGCSAFRTLSIKINDSLSYFRGSVLRFPQHRLCGMINWLSIVR
jgi:hypothetical protein